ncbi:MAG: phosphate signaling complex protein PhoU [Candidatus Nanopelagicales bacterium]
MSVHPVGPGVNLNVAVRSPETGTIALTIGQHMREAFSEQLDEVSNELVNMTRMVGSAMNRATQALLDADLQLAEDVIAADQAVDTLTSHVEDRCFDLIALQGPVASDLRVVIGALRIASSLERMGDLAEHVAKQARMRYPAVAIPTELRGTFAEMGGIAEAIVSQTGAVISTKDVGLATDIARLDQQMDHFHRELFRIVLSPSWSHGVESAVDVTLLSRFYERYADHAVSVTKRVVTIVTGEPYAGVALDASA